MEKIADNKMLVGINVWNRFEEARAAWLSFKNSANNAHFHAEFLVVDDASENEAIPNYFIPLADQGELHYIRNDKNLRLTKSWNVLLHHGVSHEFDYIVQSNSDVFFPKKWLDRFAYHLESGCEYLLPMTNNPGRFNSRQKYHPQDIRNLLPEFKDTPEAAGLSHDIMKTIEDELDPMALTSGNGFFVGFRADFLRRVALQEGEYWSETPMHINANKGVGGDESEIRKRTGVQTWLAQNVYIHHFRPQRQLGKSRQEFVRKKITTSPSLSMKGVY